jgi:hypothetical protein
MPNIPFEKEKGSGYLSVTELLLIVALKTIN